MHGFVQPGSIVPNGPNVTFVMNEFESHTPKAATGRLMTVVYKGTEPPPDTFKDDSEAIADGTFGRDGVFHANDTAGQVREQICARNSAASGRGEAGCDASCEVERVQHGVKRGSAWRSGFLGITVQPTESPATRAPTPKAPPQPSARLSASLAGVSKLFGIFAALRQVIGRSGAGPLLCAARRKRRRQIHAAAHSGGIAAAQLRHGERL